MSTQTAARALTYDEKKAAEAAFTGRPFNPDWSEAARKVYDGIAGVLGATKALDSQPVLEPAEPVA